MKKKDLTEIKSLEEIKLQSMIKKAKEELSDLILDKNMKKLKDLKSPSKKKKEIAKILTVLRQKELLKELEVKI